MNRWACRGQSGQHGRTVEWRNLGGPAGRWKHQPVLGNHNRHRVWTGCQRGS